MLDEKCKIISNFPCVIDACDDDTKWLSIKTNITSRMVGTKWKIEQSKFKMG